MKTPLHKQQDHVTQMQKLLAARNGRSYTRAEAKTILRGLAKIITTLVAIEYANRKDE